MKAFAANTELDLILMTQVEGDRQPMPESCSLVCTGKLWRTSMIVTS